MGGTLEKGKTELTNVLYLSLGSSITNPGTYTGKITYVFSCYNQDQPLDWVDFQALSERLKQNSLQEKLTVQWIKHCIPELKKQRAMV